MKASTSALALWAALGATCLAPSHARSADGIHWTITGPTSVTLSWRGIESTVLYGPTRAYGLAAIAAAMDTLPFSSPGPYRHVNIGGLQENTTYHYSIRSPRVGGGADHTFTTPPPRGTSGFTVCAEADVGSTIKYYRVGLVQSDIAAQSPDFTLVVGDLSYADTDGQISVDQHFNDVMAWSLDAAYMPIWGNHEWGHANDDMANYKGRFELPNPRTSPNAPASGCCGKDWYWFDYGNVRFISYPEPYSGAWTNWNPKAVAIMDSAQLDPAITFIVTFGHRPAYSSGYHPGDSQLRGFLDSMGVHHDKYVLNVNGHSHDYERSFPQRGVTHITIGTGGSVLEQISGTCPWFGGCPPPAWSAFRAMHHGSLRLRFSSQRIDGAMICGPPGDPSGSNLNDITCTEATVADSFTIYAPGVLDAGQPPAQAPRPFSIYPNPTARGLAVSFTLDRPGAARLDLLDLAGRRVRSLELESLGQGSHHVEFEPGPGVAPGLYWVRLTQPGGHSQKRVAILR